MAGVALSVAFWLGEQVPARGAGEPLELLAGEEPVGQVGGNLRAAFGDVAVLRMGSEAEAIGQRERAFLLVSGARTEKAAAGRAAQRKQVPRHPPQ